MNIEIKKSLLAVTTLFNLNGVSLAADASHYQPSELANFSSDGCTDIPDGIPLSRSAGWLHCCYAHDKLYFAGGSSMDRQNADLSLSHCVENASGSETLASVFYLGVRLGGGPYRHTSYRWGYGWPYGRGYEPLNADEKIWVSQRIADFDCRSEMKSFTSDEVELRRTCGQ